MSPKFPPCPILNKLPPCPVRALVAHLAAPPPRPTEKTPQLPPSPPVTHSPLAQKPVPYTLHEALHGNNGLEPCIATLHHNFPPEIHSRLQLFSSIMPRPKQALQHLFELFLLHLCLLDPTWHPVWVADLLSYLSAAADNLIPPTPPVNPSVQWTAILRDKKGRITQRVPQLEDAYPSTHNISAGHILHILTVYAPAVTNRPPITHDYLSSLPGLMDEPAKTAIMAYAWFLAAHDIPNAWLYPFLHAPLGRRERPARIPRRLSESGVIATVTTDPSGGRLSRVDEELHTLYAPPFLNRHGQLSWYTVRAAAPGEIIGRLASSFARGAVVRIDSCRRVSRSVQVHYSHVCNFEALHFRLWATWGNGRKALGAFKSLGVVDENDFTAGCPVTGLGRGTAVFDSPVTIEQALAVGYRIVEGALITPAGRRVKVWMGTDGLYRVRTAPAKGEADEEDVVEWRRGMKFG